MSERFVYHTIKRYRNAGDVDRVRSACPRSVRTKKAIETVIAANKS